MSKSECCHCGYNWQEAVVVKTGVGVVNTNMVFGTGVSAALVVKKLVESYL